MKVCLVSSSFYPSVVYGGPVISTWELSKSLADQNIRIYVSTTNANGDARLDNVNTTSHDEISNNIWVRYYHEQIRKTYIAKTIKSG